MIWIISVLILMNFLLGGALVGLAPGTYEIVQKDFWKKAYFNAWVEGYQYSNVCLRAKTLTPIVPNNTKTIISDFLIVDGITQKKLQIAITAFPPCPLCIPAEPDTTVDVTVTEI